MRFLAAATNRIVVRRSDVKPSIRGNTAKDNSTIATSKITLCTRSRQVKRVKLMVQVTGFEPFHSFIYFVRGTGDPVIDPIVRPLCTQGMKIFVKVSSVAKINRLLRPKAIVCRVLKLQYIQT